MLETIAHWDTVVTLFLNGLHTSWLDPIMYWISNRFIWIPLYVFVLIITIIKWKKKSILLILLLVLTITLSDQSCNLLKKSTKRLRPSHNVELEHKIHLVEESDGELYRGGQYGFLSAHAANAMVFALFVFFFVGKRKLWVLLAIFFWAALLGYSRIYLGVHYWLDVECGYLVGAIWFLGIRYFSTQMTRIKHITADFN
jgi:undecaprenyl-diphosphatase